MNEARWQFFLKDNGSGEIYHLGNEDGLDRVVSAIGRHLRVELDEMMLSVSENENQTERDYSIGMQKMTQEEVDALPDI